MKRLLCPTLPAASRSVPLPEAEANHAVKVLRLRDGDEVLALDGKGHQVMAILRMKGGIPSLELSERPVPAFADAADSQALPITLEMTVLKGEAMEWVVEKAVELGASALQPVLTHHTVVQMKNKGPEVFQERWQKIADQALKQCGRLSGLRVEMPVDLDEYLARPLPEGRLRLACDEVREGMSSLGEALAAGRPASASLLVGPEGGWSVQERDLLISEERLGRLKRVSLGPLVLRAETAALFGLSLLNASFHSPNWPAINIPR